MAEIFHKRKQERLFTGDNPIPFDTPLFRPMNIGLIAKVLNNNRGCDRGRVKVVAISAVTDAMTAEIATTLMRSRLRLRPLFKTLLRLSVTCHPSLAQRSHVYKSEQSSLYRLILYV